MNILQQVQNFEKKISGRIYYEYDMKRLNWFNLGGPAKIFFKPNTLDDLIIFLKNFSNILPIRVLGVGSNTLIRDGGYNGIIIKLGKNFSLLCSTYKTVEEHKIIKYIGLFLQDAVIWS